MLLLPLGCPPKQRAARDGAQDGVLGFAAQADLVPRPSNSLFCEKTQSPQDPDPELGWETHIKLQG